MSCTLSSSPCSRPTPIETNFEDAFLSTARTRDAASNVREDVRWSTGIDETSSQSLDLSDRPLLCSSVHPSAGELSVGSADHAVYTIDLVKKRLKKTLYNKNHGHQEWVTCVDYTDDGRVVSGGMDSKLCLWRRDSSSCVDLVGHHGSISGLACRGEAIVSGSYDKSVKIWNAQTGRDQATLLDHKAPIVNLVPSNSQLMATGDRGGSVLVWNIASATLAWRLKKIHSGHVTAIQWLQPKESGSTSGDANHFFTAGQDGVLRMWDLRDRSNVFKEKVHGDDLRSAAVNEILVHPTSAHLLITCGADKTIKVFDRRNRYENSLWEVALSDFPYSAGFYCPMLICSCGDGTLTVLDVESLTVKQVLNTRQAAMRFLHLIHNQLICGGDAGKQMFYQIQ